MANVVTETITVALAGVQISVNLSGSAQNNQVGSNYTKETQSIGNGSWTAIDVGSAITGGGGLGWLVVRNLDATNSVTIATDNAGAHLVATIKPGKGAYIPASSGTTYYAEASAGTVQIEFLAIEN